MKAFGKILGLGLLGLLLIIVALGFALTHLFDPNDYKDEIRQLARNKAHVELTLNGDIGWSLFPWLGLELHDASIATLTDPKAPFADLQMLGLSVRVLPLLRREVQMSDVRVEGLNLTLARDEHGHGNWEDIGKPLPAENGTTPGTPAPATGEQPAPTPERSNERAVKLDIDSLTVNNARVQYTDAQTGKSYSAESIQLSTGPVHEGSNISLKASAFLSASQPNIKARTELAGDLRFDRKLKRYNFEDMRLSGETSGEPLAGKTLSFSAQGQLLVDMGANVASWTGLKLSANQLRALGELNLRDLDKTPQLSGGLSIAQFDLRAFLDGIGQTLPPTTDPAALTKLELVSRLQGSPNALALEDLAVKLDDTSFAGRVAIEDFAKQAIRVQLKGDKFNADRYLPAKSEEAKGATAARQAEVEQQQTSVVAGSTPLPNAPTQVAWSNDKLLPVDRLRALDLQADLAFNALTLDQLPITDAQLQVTGQGGLVTLRTLRGGLYDGSFEAKGTVDVRPAVPQVGINTKINRVPVEHFIKPHGKDQTPPVKGLLTLTSDLTASGNSQKALVDTLNGSAHFTINDGVLVNANLEQQLCQAIATLNRKTLSGEPRGKDTPFQELRGSLVVRNGVASNPDLKARIPGLTVNGHGDLDLRVLGMDYNIGVVVEGDQRAMPDPACQVNERYVGVEVPLRCRGPLELGAKACRLDQNGLGKVAAKLAGDRLKDKIDEKLGEKVSPELKDALKGLFKR
ncbi:MULTISPECIES: AsmA family protein [unclassified Pseudomonas]|uniref:AsmA family protein n=1 Tax=unclassified Pseudomonas TaxID=196821 RepID=UPI0021BB7942|nr:MULTISPECIES: AsmA family protein [unclassified Pseudomonas]MCT8163271.1 AsmA family protein [Pseudomonas sp. HD6422]MCT8182194.1 AsmA family protein [Pseudomonas sp. HD6421]